MERVLPLGTGELCLGSPGCGGVVGGLGGCPGMCGGQGRGRVSTRGSHLCLSWCDALCPASQCLKASPSSLAGCRLPLPQVGERPAAKGTHPAPHLGKPQAGGSSAQPWDPLRSLLRAVAGGSRAAWPLGGLCRGQQLCSGMAQRRNTEALCHLSAAPGGLVIPRWGPVPG